MVTLMSIGAKWIQSSISQETSKVVAQRQAVAAGSRFSIYGRNCFHYHCIYMLIFIQEKDYH